MAEKHAKSCGKQSHLASNVSRTVDSKLLEKVDITIKTYPDLQPFVEMAVLILEGVYEHMSKVSTLSESEFEST